MTLSLTYLCRPVDLIVGKVSFTRLPALSSKFSIAVLDTMTIFDRYSKRLQKNRAARSDLYERCRYLKDEVGYRLADKIFDLTKFNHVCIDLGCGGGHIASHVIKENIGTLIQCDMSSEMVYRSSSSADSDVFMERIVADEELTPFREQCADLIVTSLSAHWINNLPQWFMRCFSILREDCPLIGAMFAGDTLHELRISLQLAEIERLGGLCPHISPFVQPHDIGSLMNLAGFEMITLDTDELEVTFPDMFALLYDLQSMGESNASKHRTLHLRRDIIVAADAIYRTMFAKEDGTYPASFNILSFIGWKPGPNSPKLAKKGSQNVSLKDVSKVVEGRLPVNLMTIV